MGNCMNSSARVDASHSQPTSASGIPNGSFSNDHNRSSDLPIPSIAKGDFKSSAQMLPTPRTEGEILSSPSLKAFTFSELKAASKNFRSDSLLGEGGFGCVYKAWIDHQTLTPAKSGSGMVVAVKKLKPEGFQGHREWLTEVNYLGQLHHPNLVKLIGYCLDGDNRLLVYEFMPKGSLENHLFRRGPQPLSWAIRIKVAIGAARGLAFLHDAKVIFRDFKGSNVLLDAEFNSKLSDFGLAKAGPTGDKTHVSTRVIGTQGYAAPEYVATGRLSSRSDVYSFGVVLLELLTGRPALDKSRLGIEQSLVDWAKPHLGDKRRIFRIMDTKLGGQYPQKAAMTVASLALRCLHSDPKGRPKMSEAPAELEKLQDNKAMARYSHSPERTKSVPSPAGRSPMRQRRSSLNVTPMGSPLSSSAYRQSPGLYDLGERQEEWVPSQNQLAMRGVTTPPYIQSFSRLYNRCENQLTLDIVNMKLLIYAMDHKGKMMEAENAGLAIAPDMPAKLKESRSYKRGRKANVCQSLHKDPGKRKQVTCKGIYECTTFLKSKALSFDEHCKRAFAQGRIREWRKILEGESNMEEEMKLMSHRVSRFVKITQRVQGDKFYSRWKGSVLDSVVGAFLSQNTSDQLSSSAFMSLAACFPPKQDLRLDSPKEENGCSRVVYCVDWDAVRQASAMEISNVIMLRGMNKRLAKRIKVDVNVTRATLRLGWVPAPLIHDETQTHVWDWFKLPIFHQLTLKPVKPPPSTPLKGGESNSLCRY